MGRYNNNELSGIDVLFKSELYLDNETEENYYKLLGASKEESDYEFDKHYESTKCKYKNDNEMLGQINKAYDILYEKRQLLVKPGDILGEERCLRNIEYYLYEMRKKLDEGLSKLDCLEEIHKIDININNIVYFCCHSLLKHFSTLSWQQISDGSDVVDQVFIRLKNRILGSKDEKIAGWIKNYNPEKGDFVRFARKSMSNIRYDIREYIYREHSINRDITDNDIDYLNNEKDTSNKNISLDDAKEKKKNDKKSEQKREKFGELLGITFKAMTNGPNIIRVSEAVGRESQANEYARYFMINYVLTFFKEFVPSECTVDILERVLQMMADKEIEDANISVDDIFESFDYELLDYIMSEECQELFDILEYELKNYSEIGIDIDKPIAFYRKGISRIDEILVSFYSNIKNDTDKKKDSIKVVRSRHWNSFKKLIMREQY